MTDLDDDLDALLETVRGADDPTPEQRARNRHGVLSKLAGLGLIAPIVAKTATSSALVKTAAGVTSGSIGAQVWGLVAVGGLGVATAAAAWVASDGFSSIGSSSSQTAVPLDGGEGASRRPLENVPQNRAPVASPPPVVSSAAARPAASSVVMPTKRSSQQGGGPSGAVSQSGNAASPSRTDRPTPQSAADSNAAEGAELKAALAVLGRAQQLLAQGRAESALTVLDRFAAHRRGGALWQERRALRIVALCQMGRSSAEREARRFLHQASTSPLVPRLRRVCGL